MSGAVRAARRRLAAWAGPLLLFSITVGIGFVLCAAWLTRPGA